ncbi:hypothetical protein [Lactobacillus sp. Sy-1]|uniref:hypothetical protein n=1 Tax=Lactobacillus sp. Sy-1 TaxID=2109645 RepID=UPI001C5A81A3|nr:hypothetical protein [Lactobacillus sp. Sy-1]MBW1606015.1 hypothetical protein [Lactobacillus sp. Sy-1]
MNLHDFVKKNYENGNYDFAKKNYENYNFSGGIPQGVNYNMFRHQSKDFQLGYNQALNDYKIRNKFKHYPVKLIYLINMLFNNRAIEIYNFVKGYSLAKNTLRRKKAHL